MDISNPQCRWEKDRPADCQTPSLLERLNRDVQEKARTPYIPLGERLSNKLRPWLNPFRKNGIIIKKSQAIVKISQILAGEPEGNEQLKSESLDR